MHPVSLTISHNIEIAHRLFTLPGKCQQIHGHSMWVTLTIYSAGSNEQGYATDGLGRVIEFGEVKKTFRSYLDSAWDHHLHLNKDDPWASELQVMTRGQGGTYSKDSFTDHLPGLIVHELDPSTENIAREIKQFVAEGMTLGVGVDIDIRETRTNGVLA